MHREQQPSPPASFYRRIGTQGWRDSDYFTFSFSYVAFRRWLAAQLSLSDKILSIGCGTGELETHLIAAGHRLVGLDLSHAMLKRAARAGLELPVQADAGSLPFGDASFDNVMFIESIGHLPLAAVFAEAYRVLKPRGRLMVTTYAGKVKTHPRYKKFGAAEVVAAVEAAGHRIEEKRFLDVKRHSVIEASSPERSTLLYLRATRPH